MAVRSIGRGVLIGFNFSRISVSGFPSRRIGWLSEQSIFTTTHSLNRENSTGATEKALEKELNSSGDPENKLKFAIDKLNQDIDVLTKKSQDLEDKYKRALAEGENLRKRLTKQIDDAKIFGIQSFCKDLLEVADILSKATESVPKEEVSDSNPHLKSLYEGLVMTELQLQKVFNKHGLISMNPLEEKFDPNLHEALFQQEVQGKTPGTIVVVSKIGYKLHERVIRPALVGVAKGP